VLIELDSFANLMLALPRFFIDQPLVDGAELALPFALARHVKVLRLQPGSPVSLFNGRGGEFLASITHIDRHAVAVQVGAYNPVERELARPVTLAVGMPANDRMDTLIEKGTELGMSRLVPLVCGRSVLRLHGERVEKKLEHWRGVAIAACEQCGRTRLPSLESIASLATWLQTLPPPGGDVRWALSLSEHAQPLAQQTTSIASQTSPVTILSGPEGGLRPEEEALARQHGFMLVSLGRRVLRADTAPLAALASLSAMSNV